MHLINPLFLLRDAILNGKSLLEKQIPTSMMDTRPPPLLCYILHTPNRFLFCVLEALIRCWIFFFKFYLFTSPSRPPWEFRLITLRSRVPCSSRWAHQAPAQGAEFYWGGIRSHREINWFTPSCQVTLVLADDCPLPTYCECSLVWSLKKVQLPTLWKSRIRTPKPTLSACFLSRWIFSEGGTLRAWEGCSDAWASRGLVWFKCGPVSSS